MRGEGEMLYLVEGYQICGHSLDEVSSENKEKKGFANISKGYAI